MAFALGGGSIAVDGEVEVVTADNDKGAVIYTPTKPMHSVKLGDEDEDSKAASSPIIVDDDGLVGDSRDGNQGSGRDRSSASDYTIDNDLGCQGSKADIGDDDHSQSSRRSRRRLGRGMSSISELENDDDLSSLGSKSQRSVGKSSGKGFRRSFTRKLSFAGRRKHKAVPGTKKEERELAAIETIPLYLLCEIFDYLNPRECFYVRGVSRNFRQLAAQGCSRIVFSEGAPFGGANITVSSVDFFGHYISKGNRRAEEMDISRRAPHKKSWGRSQRYSSARHEYVQEHRVQQARHVQNIRRSISSAFEPLVIDVVEKEAMRSREAMAISDLERLNVFEIGERIEIEEMICCGAAIRHRRSNTRDDKTALFLQSLDIERSTFMAKSNYTGFKPTLSGMCDQIYRDFSLKNHLRKLDLSGLNQLERLSLRGCVNLEELRLPIELMRLDARSCVKLRRVTMPLGRSQKGITALNFHGCRGLNSCAPFTEAITKRRAMTKQKNIRKKMTVDQSNLHITGHNPDSECIFGDERSQSIFVSTRQLDFSACDKLPGFIIGDAFQNCSNLVSVSLRFVATNKLICSLAGSTAAGATLRLVDVAFSEDLKDYAVLRLLAAAPKLIRMIMKNCVTITPKTYNQILRVCRKREKLALDALSGSSIEEHLDLFV